jgi:hypothetical protein
MKTKVPILALALALSLMVVGLALANAGVEWPREVLGGGASDSAADGVTLRATLGQSLVGVVTSGSGDITLAQGFWHGGSLPDGEYDIYLPLAIRG